MSNRKKDADETKASIEASNGDNDNDIPNACSATELHAESSRGFVALYWQQQFDNEEHAASRPCTESTTASTREAAGSEATSNEKKQERRSQGTSVHRRPPLIRRSSTGTSLGHNSSVPQDCLAPGLNPSSRLTPPRSHSWSLARHRNTRPREGGVPQSRTTSTTTTRGHARTPTLTLAIARPRRRTAARRSRTMDPETSCAATSTSAHTETATTRVRRRRSLTTHSTHSSHSTAAAGRPVAVAAAAAAGRRRPQSPFRRNHCALQQQEPPPLDEQLLHMSWDKLATASMHPHNDPDQTPGAFSVPGLDANADHDSTLSLQEENNHDTPASHSQEHAVSPPANRTQGQEGDRARRPSVLAVATAVVVDESSDFQDIQHQRNSLAQKQLELAEQEGRLAEQAAKLRAWEQQLEQKRIEMEATPPAAIVQASPVQPPSNNTANTSTRRRLMRHLLSASRDMHNNHQQQMQHTSIMNSLESLGSLTSTASPIAGASNNNHHSTSSSSSNMNNSWSSITAQVSRIDVTGESQSQSQPTDTMSSLDDMALARAQLGDGPMRFAPPTVYSLEQVLSRLSTSDQKAFRALKDRWDNRQAKRSMKYGVSRTKKNQELPFELPLQWHLRYLHLCAKQNKKDRSYYFSVEKAWNSERKVQRRVLSLNVFKLREQLRSKTLFPVPGLKTKGGHNMFYMRPARYFPNKTSVKTIIDNLCFVMNSMLENNEKAQKEGIGFVACMDDWAMKNFDVNYCFQFMMALQGFMVPVKTQLFLIVNPPSWFGGIWRIMKPMLAPSFRKRVKICPEGKIGKYLFGNYQHYLPDDMSTGQANTHAMVEDFIAFREFVEQDVIGDDDVHSIALSEASPVFHSGNLDYQEMRSMGPMSYSSSRSDHSYSSSLHSSASRFSCSHSSCCSSDDEASIHCDIHDDDMESEDMKQAATPEQTPTQSFSSGISRLDE